MSIIEHQICSVFIDLWRLEQKFQQPWCYPFEGSTVVRKRFIGLKIDARTIGLVPCCHRSGSFDRLSSAEGWIRERYGDPRLWWSNFDVYNYLNVLFASVFIDACTCTRDKRTSWGCARYERKKWGVYCFMLSGLCHVGCARLAGQKYLIKLYSLVLERRGTGFCLDLLSVCVASFLFFHALSLLLRLPISHRSSGYLFCMDKLFVLNFA